MWCYQYFIKDLGILHCNSHQVSLYAITDKISQQASSYLEHDAAPLSNVLLESSSIQDSGQKCTVPHLSSLWSYRIQLKKIVNDILIGCTSLTGHHRVCQQNRWCLLRFCLYATIILFAPWALLLLLWHTSLNKNHMDEQRRISSHKTIIYKLFCCCSTDPESFWCSVIAISSISLSHPFAAMWWGDDSMHELPILKNWNWL